MRSPAPAVLAAALLASCTSPATVPTPAAVVGDPTVAASAILPAAKPRPKPASRAKARPVLRPPWVADVARCIRHRESRGNYRVVNHSSGSAGAYQFMLSTSNYVARSLMHNPRLVGVPANRWRKRQQDRAFRLLFDHGRGRGHWWLDGGPQCW